MNSTYTTDKKKDESQDHNEKNSDSELVKNDLLKTAIDSPIEINDVSLCDSSQETESKSTIETFEKSSGCVNNLSPQSLSTNSNEPESKSVEETEYSKDSIRSKDNESEPLIIENVNSAESMRMIMMIIVEQKGSEISCESLQPIIESGLKKFEESKPVNCETSQNKHLMITPKKIRSKEPESVVTSIKKIDFVQISKTSYMTPVKQTKKQNIAPKNSHNSLISTMTSALMGAFRKIPDKINFSNLIRSPPLAALPASPLRENNSIKPEMPVKAIEMTPSRKRRRDEFESVFSSPSKSRFKSTESESTPLTPCTKKYRGSWIKIKARPPIARMRRSENQACISLKKQCFQQGMLSVGNAMIPLPSRAQEDKSKE